MEIIATVLSLVVGFARRGRFSGLADMFDESRHFWLILVPFACVAISWIGLDKVPDKTWIPVTGYLQILGNVGFIGFFIANLRLPGMKLLLIGQALNFIPVVTNGGKMPVSAWAARIAQIPAAEGTYMRHVEMTQATHFKFLADIIPVPPAGVAAIGDIFISAGLIILIQVAMCSRKPAAKGADVQDN